MPPTRSYGFGEGSIRVSPSGSPWRGSGRGSRRSECWGARQGPREGQAGVGLGHGTGMGEEEPGCVCRVSNPVSSPPSAPGHRRP